MPAPQPSLRDALQSAAVRGMAMARLEAGVRAGADWMVEILKSVVSGPGGVSKPLGRPGFIYFEETGGRKTKRKAPKWSDAPAFRHRGPPGMSSGSGMDSIKFQITEIDFGAGTIKVKIGVDDSAPGGMTTLRSYMMGHEFGIRYPTKGAAKGTGPVVQHPWLRPTLRQYMAVMNAIVRETAREG